MLGGGTDIRSYSAEGRIDAPPFGPNLCAGTVVGQVSELPYDLDHTTSMLRYLIVLGLRFPSATRSCRQDILPRST